MNAINKEQLTLRSTFKFEQALLHLLHIDGLSTALLATLFFFCDAFRGERVDVVLTVTLSARRYGLNVVSKSCSTDVRRESNRFKE